MNFHLLPQQIQQEIIDFRKNHKEKFIEISGHNLVLTDLNASDIIKILELCDGWIEKSTTFKAGQFIVSSIWIENNMLMIFQANNDDEREYSGKNREYIIFPKLKSIF